MRTWGSSEALVVLYFLVWHPEIVHPPRKILQLKRESHSLNHSLLGCHWWPPCSEHGSWKWTSLLSRTYIEGIPFYCETALRPDLAAACSCTIHWLRTVSIFFHGLKKHTQTWQRQYVAHTPEIFIIWPFTGKFAYPCKPLHQSGVTPTWGWPRRALCWVSPPFPLMVGLWSSRTNSSERPGNQGPKTEDSRSHGRHAQHNVQCRHQPPEPGFPPLLFQICGDQPLRTRPQRLCLPAHEEVKTSCVSLTAWSPEGIAKKHPWQSR